MQKIKKILKIICVNLLFMPFIVLAEESVVKINDVGYSSIETAIGAAKVGDELVLQSDIDTKIEISYDKDITINLNDFSVYSTIRNDGKLTLLGEGKLELVDSIRNKENAILTIKNVSIDDNRDGTAFNFFIMRVL